VSKKIVHITCVHPPFDARIFHKECKTLARNGYEVKLVAQHDKDEIVDGIQILSISKPRNRLERMFFSVIESYRKAVAEKADLYHFHDPELIPAGILLKVRGYRVIYDAHEDVPTQMRIKNWIHPVFKGIFGSMAAAAEWIGSGVFDGVVAATPKIATHFPGKKTVVVQNFPQLAESLENAATPYREREPILAYTGVVSHLRGAMEMVEALGKIPDGQKVQLQIAGFFSPADLQSRMQNLSGWSRVVFLGWQSRPEIAALLGRARIGLVLLHPTKSYLDSYPTKLFEYMAVGIPVITSDFPLWRKIISEAKCGMVVDPKDPSGIANAISWMLAHEDEAEAMGIRGRRAVLERYNWESEARKLLSISEKLTG